MRESVQSGLSPCAAGGRGQLEDRAASVVLTSTQIAPCRCGAIEIARGIENQASDRISSIALAGKFIQNFFRPASARTTHQFVNRSAANAAAIRVTAPQGCSIKISRGIQYDA